MIGALKRKPTAVFVNHGEDEVCNIFADTLTEQLGYTAYAPYSGTCYDLLAEKFETVTTGIPVAKKERLTKSARVLGELVAAAERLLKVSKTLAGRSNRELRIYIERINAIIDRMTQ